MGRLAFPKHIVLSLPRLLACGAVAIATVGGGASAYAYTMNNAAARPMPTARRTVAAAVTPSHQPTPAAAPPVSTQQQAPAVQPPTPKPATLAEAPRSNTPAPVVTPSSHASVSGLAPVDPTPTATTPPADSSTAPDTTQSTTPPTQTPSQQTTGYTSTNWSGYMATTGHYTSVSGSWTVPSVSGVSGTTSADAAWVGIGGAATNDLIQAGTFDTVDSSGRVTVQAFYELLPAAARFDTGLHVSVGDRLVASITETAPNQWHLAIADTSTGKSFAVNTAYTSSYSSAEWVEEDPSQLAYGSISLMPLDIFSAVSFIGGGTTDSGTSRTIAGSNALPITLISGSSRRPHVLALPSSISADGGAFSVTRTQ